MAETPKDRNTTLFGSLLVVALIPLAAFVGCGSTDELSDGWEDTPPVSATATLEYRVDSLMNQNRIMKQQMDALASENQSLRARSAELETKLDEAISAMEFISTPPPEGTTPGQATGYEQALAEFRNRNYESAIRQFEGLLSGGINDKLVPNCHYWIGESLYGLRRYSQAIAQFEEVLKYVTSEKKSYAQFMIGNCQIASGNRDAAREAFNTFLNTYPTSPLQKKAQERLASL